MYNLINLTLCIVLSAGSVTAKKPAPIPPPPATAPVAAHPARISIDIDGEVASMTIPVGSPALLEHNGWTKSFAIVATDRVGDGPSTISIALIPADTTNDKTTKAEVIKMAVVSKSITATEALDLVPGKDIPAEVFGKAAPKRFAIRLVTKK